MDPGLDQDKAELGILVLAVDLEVLADGHRLFDEVPKVLGDGRCQSYPQTKRYPKDMENARRAKEEKKRRQSAYEDRAPREGEWWNREGNWRRTVRFKHTQDLVTSDEAHLGDTVRVTEGYTDLGGGEALAGELDDVLDNIIVGGFEPGGGSPAVRKGRGRCGYLVSS